MKAIAAGKLPPDQGSSLLQALAAQARIAELDDVIKRLEALENADGSS
jgi:hypothetical protein